MVIMMKIVNMVICMYLSRRVDHMVNNASYMGGM